MGNKGVAAAGLIHGRDEIYRVSVRRLRNWSNSSMNCDPGFRAVDTAAEREPPVERLTV